jgi:hypothetical protein
MGVPGRAILAGFGAPPPEFGCTRGAGRGGAGFDAGGFFGGLFWSEAHPGAAASHTTPTIWMAPFILISPTPHYYIFGGAAGSEITK